MTLIDYYILWAWQKGETDLKVLTFSSTKLTSFGTYINFFCLCGYCLLLIGYWYLYECLQILLNSDSNWKKNAPVVNVFRHNILDMWTVQLAKSQWTLLSFNFFFLSMILFFSLKKKIISSGATFRQLIASVVLSNNNNIKKIMVLDRWSSTYNVFVLTLGVWTIWSLVIGCPSSIKYGLHFVK